jgi:small subunit ribosomal protein S6
MGSGSISEPSPESKFLPDKPSVHKGIALNMMNRYETMYILRPDISEEDVDNAIEKYQTILRDHGAQITETLHRNKRRLAYEIQKYREGIYIQMNYEADGSQIAIMERAMRLSDEVIRYLTIRQEAPKAAKEEEAVQV